MNTENKSKKKKSDNIKRNKQRNDVLTNLTDFWREYGDKTVDAFQERLSKWPTDLEEYIPSFEQFEEKLTKDDCVLVLTANSVETNMMVRLLAQENDGTKIQSYIADDCWYRFGKICGLNIVHLQPQETSSFTQKGAARALNAAFKRFYPKLVVSLGVAFGVNENEQHIGDVLVSEDLCAYDTRNKRIDGKLYLPKGGIVSTDEHLMCAWSNLLTYESFPGDIPIESHPFKWYCGLMLSGGTVLSDIKERNRLVKEVSKKGYSCIGGEMEGNGVYFECKNENIPCVVIKGICDWGAEKNGWKKVLEELSKNNPDIKIHSNDTMKDCVQAFAMLNAFTAFKYLISVNAGAILKKHDDSSNTGTTQCQNKKHQPANIVTHIPSVLCCVLLLLSLLSLLNPTIVHAINHGYINYCYVLLPSFLALLCIVYLLWRLNTYLCSPENLAIEAANLQLWKLDFKNCIGNIQNIDGIPLNNLRIGWVNKCKRIIVRALKAQELEAEKAIWVGYETCISNESQNLYLNDIPCPIKPDTLQIEYSLNGKRFYHIFKNPKYAPKKVFSYVEYIYVENGDKYRKLSGRRCVVKLDKEIRRGNYSTIV